jgi:UDP-glucose 4-epimerase
MKIVISGGLGYVGGRLSKYFAEQGHEVISLSRQAGNFSEVNFPSGIIVAHPDVVLADNSLIRRADVFIHLAAMNEHDCIRYPEKAIDVNITGTLRWLNAAHQTGIPKFVYFSTAHVYGKPLEGYFDESSLTRSVHPYAITHKCAEDYVLAYSIDMGMSNLVIRLTNAFGGPAFPTADRWTLLVNDLCRSAVKNQKMVLHSDGLQLRDFVALEDVCRAANHLFQLTNFEAEPIYNLGSGNSITVLTMALTIKAIAQDVLQVPVTLIRNADAGQMTRQLHIDNKKLVNSGFHLKNPMIDEIRSTIDYFQKLDIYEPGSKK